MATELGGAPSSGGAYPSLPRGDHGFPGGKALDPRQRRLPSRTGNQSIEFQWRRIKKCPNLILVISSQSVVIDEFVAKKYRWKVKCVRLQSASMSKAPLTRALG
jgi:hypothetical protein